MRTLSLDLETYSGVDLKKCGVYAYAGYLDFEILLLAYAFDDDPVNIIDLASGEELPLEIRAALTDPWIIKTAFNANFERTCLARYLGTSLPPEQWRCTQAHALTLGLPSHLEGVARCLKLPQQKMEEGKPLIRYFSMPCKPTRANGERTRNLPEHDLEKWRLFKAYCKQDVEVEREIRRKLASYPMPEKELKLWILDQQINDAGVQVDTKLVESAIRCDHAYQEKLVQEASRLTGLDNPNSPAQLKEWLRENHDIEVESLSKDTVVELLENVDDLAVKRVLELRLGMARTSIRKYEAMRRAVGRDGRVRGLLQYYGANRTGRWAGRLVQIHNLPRNNLLDLQLARQLLKSGEDETLELLFPSVPEVLSQLIRTAFIPSPGCRFIVSDFSAIEARVIAWLAGEKWRLNVFCTHGKIYEASAAQMFGVPVESIGKGSELRQKGKVAELACGFGSGEGGLIAMGALRMGLKEEELPGIITAWRKANPNIVRFWWDVERAAMEAVREKKTVKLQHGLTFYCKSGVLFMRLPSGRSLAYVRPRIEIDTRFGKDKLTYEGIEQSSRKWCRIGTYGGKLVENCLAGNTEILTDRGWVQIVNVKSSDLLWDGIEWVSHHGLLAKGVQKTITLDGVSLTPDHLILTEGGWRSASSCKGHYRLAVTLPDSSRVCRFRREKIPMEGPMQPQNESNHHNPLGGNDRGRSFSQVRDRLNNAPIQTGSRYTGRPLVCKPGCEKPVYDILNAGPRHRFVVKGDSAPFIVHNCVQAIARDCLAEALLRLDQAGYKIAFHVHDEVVLDVPRGTGSLKEVEAIMSQPIEWAPGLPLNASGFETDFYMKD